MINNNKNKLIGLIALGVLLMPMPSLASQPNIDNENILITQDLNYFESKFKDIKLNKVEPNINLINQLIKEINDSELIFTEKHDLITEIKTFKSNLNKGENPNDKNELLRLKDKLEKEIQFKLIDKKPYLTYPSIDDGYNLSFSILNQDNGDKIEAKLVGDGLIELPKLNRITNLEIAISIIENKTGKETFALLIDKVFNDTEKPKLNYAYIKNGVVFINFNDNYQLNDEPAYYKLGSSKDFQKIEDNKFFLNQKEDSFSLILKDLFNNEAKYEIEVKKDNTPLYGQVPRDILADLLEEEAIVPENKENLIIVETGREIDVKKVFLSLINDFYKDDNIRIFNGSDDVTHSLKSNTPGLKKLLAKDSKGKLLDIYIYFVKDINNIDSHTKSIQAKLEGKIPVLKDSQINLLDYIEVLTFNNKLPDNIFFKDPESSLVYPIDKSFNLIKNSNNLIELYDILSNKTYFFNIVHNENINSNTSIEKDQAKFDSTGNIPVVPFKQYYLDVDKDFWASNAITRLTDSGVLKGYDDRMFKPNDNMTIKEFLVMFGRFVALQEPSILNPNIKNRAVDFEYWGEAEANNVITRIKPSKFSQLDTSDYSRYITKEEVAFIIANTIILDKDTSLGTTLTDIDTSPFKKEIEQVFLNNISKGMPDGSFGPKRNIKRAEVVELLNNMLK